MLFFTEKAFLLGAFDVIKTKDEVLLVAYIIQLYYQ